MSQIIDSLSSGSKAVFFIQYLKPTNSIKMSSKIFNSTLIYY